MNTNIKILVKQILCSNASVARWALLRVYDNQNECEQVSGQAMECNGQGFSKCDSEILTSFSYFLQGRGFLSAKQMIIVHRCIPKYWRQIVEGLSPAELDALLAGKVPPTPVANRQLMGALK